ncbi:50S ribosomal protein L3 [bacterium]|nr:50S ribosomal protein L3 [bacterium]|tara:strand:+ start:19024 stop:19653 length:630 start_codon:yes stop_codon:yes gene_type:complete
MAKFILGTKVNMTQFFDENGRAYPATLINAGPITVTQMKMNEKDGYQAIQVGYGVAKKLNKALAGHFGKLGTFRHVKEFRIADSKKNNVSHKVGDVVNVTAFEPGEKITVSGVSKGKGFQGVVKRHGFHGGPRTHGQKHSEREPGSIGATGPQRVFKGKRMAGRMGGDRTTVKNLKILAVDEKNNQLLISGAIPGHRGTLIEIRGTNFN